MSKKNPVRWWCHGCTEDQYDDVWTHYNRERDEVLCGKCKTAKYPTGVNANDNRSDITRHNDSNQLPRRSSPDKADMQEPA